MRKKLIIFFVILFSTTLISGCSTNDGSVKVQNTSSESEPVEVADADADLSFGCLDRDMFNSYLSDGGYRCGSDFEAGDDYILSIH